MENAAADQWVGERMVQTGRNYAVQRQRLITKQPDLKLVKITQGFYLNVADLPPGLPHWELRRIVSFPRMFAVREQAGARQRPVVFTGECAAVASGVSTVWSVPNIAFRVEGKRKHKRELPPVAIAGCIVPKAYAYHVTGGMRMNEKECSRTPSGLVLAPPPVLIADECRRYHPMKRFTAGSALLTRLTGFVWRNPGPSRQAARGVKRAWLRRAEEIKDGRAYRVYHAVIRGLDVGIQSPVEAMALYAVKCHLPERKYDRVQTQFHVLTSVGSFYLDIAFPEMLEGLEADGRIKYGKDAKAIDAYAASHVRRHQALVNEGWAISHVTSEQLGQPSMLATIGKAMQDIRVLPPGRPPAPRGALYKPLSADLFHRARRF